MLYIYIYIYIYIISHYFYNHTIIRRQGVNASFLVKSQSTLASLYKEDPAMLEKHHRPARPPARPRVCARGPVCRCGVTV